MGLALDRMKLIRTGCFLCLLSLAWLVQAAEPSAATAPATSAPLRQVLLAEGIEAAQGLALIENGELVVLAPTIAFLDGKNLSQRLAAGRNRPIDEPLLAAVAKVVEIFLRENDFPAAQVVIPPQDISNGAVRVAVLLGKIRKVEVSGNYWFSESLLRRKLQIDRGETLRFSELDRAIAWTNDSSPFRRVRVNVQPVPQTGEVDVVIAVQERMPLRLQANYDNSGNDVIGLHRYIAAVTYANMWGIDHQATYQYLTSNLGNIFQGHALDYRIPLPWRHVVQFAGSYSRATPSLFDGFITQVGESIAADLRYLAPLKLKGWRAEGSATIGFKETNNNLFFLDEPVPFETTDLFTLNLGITASRDARRGRWLASANLIASPGDINSRSTAAAYRDSRFGAKPRFVYGQVALQRLTQLTPRLVSTARVIAQLSSANLLGSEQFSVGGFNTVRGYTDRALSGDSGYTLSHELQRQGPSFSVAKRLPELTTAGLIFADYGRVYVKHPFGNQLKSADIAGAGIGLRLSAGNNFSAGLDYAWPLIKMVGESSRLHVKVTLAY